MNDQERDPFALSHEREQEADRLQQRSQEFADEVKRTREEWERKRADDAVPGAAPPEGQEAEGQEAEGQEAEDREAEDRGGDERRGNPTSPAPQAPPPSEGPADATTPPEGAVGWPADAGDED